ncbi:hypothetical protein SLEP1_g14586 [Rubroshorea leprosula]|uniref:Uncharacterized protein n=1 Tax=Rubroshorea leprosula TaxID=152421 RepID=A0AAV5IQL0_9ROSI|nr:hypothetical protein SLEP1_g14586 [Rubroshorea leprosula]
MEPHSRRFLEIGVLKEPHEIRLGSLLESSDCTALELEIGLEILSDLSHKALEQKLSDQELSTLWYFLISLRATVPGLKR